MNVQFLLWHAFAGCGMNQLANGKKILDICRGSVQAEFGQFVHRSNPITVPSDGRLTTRGFKGKRATYPSDWHFRWKEWAQALLIVPNGFSPTRFAICSYITATRELKICSKMRRIADGPFAMRLTDQDQQLFVIAERQVSLRSGGIFGGMGETDRPLPEKIDLY